MICNVCGKEIGEEKVCPDCGAIQENSVEAPAVEAPVKEKVNIVYIIFSIFFTAFGVTYWAIKKDEDVNAKIYMIISLVVTGVSILFSSCAGVISGIAGVIGGFAGY